MNINVVKYYMLKENINNNELAKSMGCSPTVISLKINGKTKWTGEDIFKLHKVLGIPFEELRCMYE